MQGHHLFLTADKYAEWKQIKIETREGNLWGKGGRITYWFNELYARNNKMRVGTGRNTAVTQCMGCSWDGEAETSGGSGSHTRSCCRLTAE